MSKRALPGEWETSRESKRPNQAGLTGGSRSLITRSGLSKTYSHFHTSGDARVHAGDNIYNITTDDLGLHSLNSFSNLILRIIGCGVFFYSQVADLLLLDPVARSRDREIKRLLEVLNNLHNDLQDRANASLGRKGVDAEAQSEAVHGADALKEAASNLFYSCVRSRSRLSELDEQRRKFRDLCDVLASLLPDTLKKSLECAANSHRLSHSWNVAFTSEMSVNVRVAFYSFQQAKISPLLAKLNEDLNRPRKVLDPFPDTYHWALKRDEAGLKSWLQSNNGIYWITGKPGAGKSTLMKFLINSSGRLLADWADGQRWVMASFFFWYAGSPSQKSITGLLRSIMYQLIRSNRPLANIAFPRWHPDQESWTEPELMDALQNVIDSAALGLVAERFCFFIDGLDEYSGNNHLELIKIIQDLAKSQHVKLCVSSRPLYAYRLAFESSVPSLRLEELNANDMIVYVSRRLTNESSFTANDTSSLVTEVVRGSEGVFVWVVLVVESILEGLAEGESMSFIRNRVSEFPQDLGPFFKAILQRVGHGYRARSAQALKLAWLSTEFFMHQIWIPNCTDYWLIGQHPQGIQDPGFAYQLPPEVIAIDKSALILEETRKLLSAATKGLLVLNEADRSVEMIHRTVHDFLGSAQMTRELDDSIPGHFKSAAMLHLLNITRMKLWPHRHFQIESILFWNGGEAISDDVAGLMAQKRRNTVTESGSFVNILSSVTKRDYQEHIEVDYLAQLNASGQYATEFERAVNHVRSCFQFPPLDTDAFRNLWHISAAVMDMTYIFRMKTSSEAASDGNVSVVESESQTNEAPLEPVHKEAGHSPVTTKELWSAVYPAETRHVENDYLSEVVSDQSGHHCPSEIPQVGGGFASGVALDQSGYLYPSEIQLDDGSPNNPSVGSIRRSTAENMRRFDAAWNRCHATSFEWPEERDDMT